MVKTTHIFGGLTRIYNCATLSFVAQKIKTYEVQYGFHSKKVVWVYGGSGIYHLGSVRNSQIHSRHPKSTVRPVEDRSISVQLRGADVSCRSSLASLTENGARGEDFAQIASVLHSLKSSTTHVWGCALFFLQKYMLADFSRGFQSSTNLRLSIDNHRFLNAKIPKSF